MRIFFFFWKKKKRTKKKFKRSGGEGGRGNFLFLFEDSIFFLTCVAHVMTRRSSCGSALHDCVSMYLLEKKKKEEME